MKHLTTLLLTLLVLGGCSYSEEEKEEMKAAEIELQKNIEEMASCSTEENHGWISKSAAKAHSHCKELKDWSYRIRYTNESVQINCAMEGSSGRQYAVCEATGGIELLYNQRNPSSLKYETAGICLDVTKKESTYSCEKFMKEDTRNLSDREKLNSQKFQIEQACDYSFDKALNPDSFDISEGIFKWVNLASSKESYELGTQIMHKSRGDVEGGPFTCRCILNDFLKMGNSRFDYCSGPKYAPK